MQCKTLSDEKALLMLYIVNIDSLAFCGLGGIAKIEPPSIGTQIVCLWQSYCSDIPAERSKHTHGSKSAPSKNLLS